ncbi:MAG TPA: S53 family peptidase [Streptosporangiaceae bacterium]|nr:S53 family peptidase [Streptosporangiaceae bacterium]
MNRKTHARLTAGILIGAGAVVAALAVAPGAVASPSQDPTTPTQVPSGVNPATLPGATVFGSTPADTPVTVSFVLKEQDIQSLEAQVVAGIPSSRYLSVSQFAARYGQPSSNINALTSYLAGFGITTSVYADDVDVVANGTAGEFDNALTITEENVHVPQQGGLGGFGPVRAQDVFTNKQEPLLPYHLASFVTAILGLSDYGPFVNTIAMPSSHDLPQQGSSNSCAAEFGLTNGCHLPSFFSSTYNLAPLYAHANGTGQTVGIVTLAAVDPGAPEFFWSNVADVNRTGNFTVDNVDGGPGAASAASGSSETDLDVEQSGALAPGADVIDYQAPNTDSGFSDAFFTAASQNIASGVSASWGSSETEIQAEIRSSTETAGYAEAFDEAFLEMAAQGQSAFTSSADDGAYTATADLGTTNLSADIPADSPYVTATGGTTLPGSTFLSGPDGTATATTTAQRIWGWDYLWAPVAQITGEPLADVAESLVVGSGGGFSVLEPEPFYQREVSGTSTFHAVEYLTPTDFTEVAPGLSEPTEFDFNPTPSVTAGFGFGRVVPDLATDADPQTGYLVYGASDGGLNEAGGTSFVDPQMNGSAVVIDSFLGHRTGFWNPVIYRAAASGNDPFTQINTAGTSSDNIFYTGNPGQEYNQGIGLGLPDLAAIAGFLGRS